MHFPERLAGKEKRKLFFRRLLWMGLSVIDGGYVHVCFLGQFWCVIPEIAKEIWNSNWLARRREEGVRGRWQGRRKWREGGRVVVDRKLMIKPASLSNPPLLSSCTQSSYCFVCFPRFFSSPPCLPPSLCYFEALIAFLPDAPLADCHPNQHPKTILRTFYPNPVPPTWSSLKTSGGGEGVCGGGSLNAVNCQGFNLNSTPSAICPPHSFTHRNGNSFVWSCFSLQKTGVKCGVWFTFHDIPAKFLHTGEGRPPSELP